MTSRVVVVAAGLAAACTHAPRPAADLAPAESEVVAPGIVSGGSVYRGSFAPDERTLYFFRKVGPSNGEDYRIFRATRSADGWTPAERVALGGDHSDLYPALSRDGRTLVFSSYRPAPGDTSAHRNAHLWVATRTAAGWSAPRFLAEASRPGWYHSQPFFAHDGSLYVKRTSPDWRTAEQVVVPFDGTAFGAPRPYEALSQWSTRLADRVVHHVFPAPDDSTVLLELSTRDPATRRPGPSDLWFAVRRGGAWSEPRPLGAGVNSPGTDNFPFFSPDGATLYFVRDFTELRRVRLGAALGR